MIRKAFTLAEVLITLAVIGVVASLTVPGLLTSSIEDANYKKFKKDFADFSAAHNLILQENGGDITSVFETTYTILDEYKKKLSSVKNSIHTDDCWHGGLGSWNFLSGEPQDAYGTGRCMILGDGTWVFVHGDSIASFFMFDVNGSKPPNRAGIDIFMAGGDKTKFYPFGAIGYNAEGECDLPNRTGTGFGCAAWVLQNY